VIPKVEEGYYKNLFTWKDLENIINIRPLMKSERIYAPGVEEKFQWDANRWMTDTSCYPSTIIKKFIDEYVTIITDVSRYNEKLNEFCSKLENKVERCVDAQIFLCRNLNIKDHPFGIHYDRNNNVIVQCEGITNWKVWDYIDESDPDNHLKHDIQSVGSTQMKNLGDPIINFDLKPGDAIWVPHQHPHLATSKTKRMSISFPWQDKPIPANINIQDRTWVKI
tara:strand:- start:96 stop:764 length:669 start_codon:yes stop_codon:yes gene_type:complete